MTRIRYVRYGNKLVNKELILLGADTLQVNLDLGTNTFSITNTVNGSVVAQGAASSAATLKMKVKKLLRSVGVKFDDEIRNRGQVKTLKLDGLEANA